MNTKIKIAGMLLLSCLSCKKEEIITVEPEPMVKAEIPFTGKWTRTFDVGPDNLHTAQYFIYQDSIRYTLVGSVGNADYLMERDTFILEEQRFIGHTNSNQYYVLFAKDLSADSIMIYKVFVSNFSAAMSFAVPSDTSTQNYGWNTFKN